MPLSEREQKLLEQLEQQLNADDPGFAQSLNREGSRGAAPAAAYSLRHLVLGVLIAVAGLGVVDVVPVWFVSVGVGVVALVAGGRGHRPGAARSSPPCDRQFGSSCSTPSPDRAENSPRGLASSAGPPPYPWW